VDIGNFTRDGTVAILELNRQTNSIDQKNLVRVSLDGFNKWPAFGCNDLPLESGVIRDIGFAF